MRLRTAQTIPKVEKIPALPLVDGKDGVDWGKLDSAQKVASSKTDVPHLERSGNVSPVQRRCFTCSASFDDKLYLTLARHFLTFSFF
jgi:hypothetical protein